MAGLAVLKACLDRQGAVACRIVRGDEPWPDGPAQLAAADGIVCYLSQGAQWFRADPRRLTALRDLAARKGGIVAIHWAVGAKDAEHIPDCLALIGGCHGGPDRKYIVAPALVRLAPGAGPIANGLADFRVVDEFYYRLKWARPPGLIRPVLQTEIHGQLETIAWMWERPDGGRSFGITSLHFHRNWELPTYRRLIVQAVLWSLNQPIPAAGVDVHLVPGSLAPAPPESEAVRRKLAEASASP